jgi:transposase InsO family protein
VSYHTNKPQEVFVSHRNARLTPAGRLILVTRIAAGRPVAHVAKEMGVSRKCAALWRDRYEQFGLAGLEDGSSVPKRMPAKTAGIVEDLVVLARERLRLGPAELAAVVGVPARTISRILARRGMPRLWELDPVTGVRIRAGRATEHRYERERPGELVHVDVKKLGRIPDGGGWRVHGRSHAVRGRKLGFDYVHSAVDDHSRLAYSEVLPDEKADTCAGFLTRAAAFYANHGITIQRVMTDNALAYRKSAAVRQAIATLGATHKFTRPRSPWQNGKVERFNRTLQEAWAYRHPFASNQHRTDALTPWLQHYNYTRPHTACGGQPPISRVSPTS